ncbi:MAG: hypothetical protein A2017_16960 [Lentisphaerae bacterium GWF2_44_16]|nr:MAG: hypothetical protein A2017_16960 [Lentisphaerae bacterium GWF2_44_16]
MRRDFLSALAFFTLGNLTMIQDAHAVSDLTIKSDKPFIITYPDTPLPVEKTAAEELAKYINQSTETKTETVPESKLERKDSADAYIGQCAFTKEQNFYRKKFKQEEFSILIKDGKLFIYGDDGKGDPFAHNIRTGTLFGVYDFLENNLGITWIWPGKSGEDVPEKKEWALPAFSKTDSPRLLYRGIKFSSAYKEAQEFNTDLKHWFKKMKLSWIPQAWFGHSWGNYMMKTGMDKQHPEWMALWGSERKGPHCCTSNKEFRDYIVEQCLNNPMNKDKWIVSISPNDGYGFCECEKCRAIDPAGTDYKSGTPNLSNRHWDYANYIAKEVKKRKPELNVGMLAYTAYTKPPTNINKFEDNLYVSLCFSAAYCVLPDKKKEFQENILKWNSLGAKLVDYEYWGMHYWLDLPYIFTKQIREFMPFMYKNGLLGMHGEAQKNFATQGPNYYLAAHLMWNPESDSDKILERYYKAFGPAANYIKGYYDTFEKSIQENQKCDFAYLALINSWPEIFPEKTVSQAGEYIQKAKDAVKDNPIYAERVRLVDIGYEYTKNMLELLGIYRKLGRAGVPLWCFGYQGAIAEFKFWKTLPEMPNAWVEFWKKHPDEPLEKEEKIKLLKRALHLGNERERILTENANLPVVSIGMYNYFKTRGYYQWHQAIREELEKENIKIE